MPPLQEISGNARRGSDMSPYERGKMDAWHEDGISMYEIARRLSRPSSTIVSSLAVIGRDAGESLARSGRPTILTVREERKVLTHCMERAEDLI